MSTETERLIPNNISDTGTIDDDSGLRLFRGMMTPWDKIKSFKETYNFIVRHSALMAVSYVNAFKVIEPDYEKRTSAMTSIWGGQMKQLWAPELGQLAQFEDSFDVPPFIKDGVYRAATYADQGDEQVLMPGHIMYASNDRVEKEIHQCQWDIVGPEACDVSVGGGQHFCIGIAKTHLNNYDPERKGCGDAYCVAIMEAERKYGEHRNKDGYEWEEWGPTAGGLREKGTPRKTENEFLNTGLFTAATGATFTAGEMYKKFAFWPMFMSYHTIEGIRALVPDAEKSKAWAIVDVMFDTAGKLQFGEWNTRKAAREWMGVPPDVDDGRVQGGYISMILQSRSIPWKFTEFTPERTVVECDKLMLNMMGQYPEFTPAYVAYFNGMVKTLVNCEWIVKLDEKAPEDKVRFVIEKGLYGFRRQKPGYAYEKKENK
jgi:hypothetical protein